jgi:uncharacterized membrane protein
VSYFFKERAMRVFLWALVAIFLSQTAAFAQSFPSLFNVTGVASNDVLNIRQAPDATTTILSSFAYNARDVEVIGLSENGRWGMVATSDQMGWVAMRFLDNAGRPNWTDGQSLHCSGTEPFWSLSTSFPDRHLSLQTINGHYFGLQTNSGALPHTVGPPTLGFAIFGARKGFASVRTEVCADGMSDHLYGLGIQVYFTDNGQAFSGCCSLR